MKTYIQTDKLGRYLVVDDCVAYESYYGGITVGRVTKINRARVRIMRVTDTNLRNTPEDIMPRDIVRIDSKDVSFYLLKNKK